MPRHHVSKPVSRFIAGLTVALAVVTLSTAPAAAHHRADGHRAGSAHQRFDGKRYYALRRDTDRGHRGTAGGATGRKIG